MSIASSFGDPKTSDPATTTSRTGLSTTSTAARSVASHVTSASAPLSASTPITSAQPGTRAGIDQECGAELRVLMIQRGRGSGPPDVSHTQEFATCRQRLRARHATDSAAIAVRCITEVTNKLFLIKRVR